MYLYESHLNLQRTFNKTSPNPSNILRASCRHVQLWEYSLLAVWCIKIEVTKTGMSKWPAAYKSYFLALEHFLSSPSLLFAFCKVQHQMSQHILDSIDHFLTFYTCSSELPERQIYYARLWFTRRPIFLQPSHKQDYKSHIIWWVEDLGRSKPLGMKQKYFISFKCHS